MNSSVTLPVPTSTTSSIWDSLAVFIAGLLVQFFFLAHTPLIAIPESAEYAALGLKLLSGGSLAVVPENVAAGYPTFLAALFVLFSKSGLPVIFVQHFLIAALGSLLTLIAGYYSKRLYAITIGLLVSLDPALGLFGSMLIPEVLFGFLVTIAVTASLRMRTSPFAAAFAGIVFGFATLVRPSALVAFVATVFLTALSFWVRYLPTRHLLNVLSLLFLGFLVVLIPWMTLRYSTYGSLSITGNISSFLKVQRILQTGNFDPALIEEKEIRQYFVTLATERSKQSAEEKLYRRDFSLVFRDYLRKTLSPEHLDKWYDTYLERYKGAHPRKYYIQMFDSFFAMMHLNRHSDFTPRVAHNFLGGGKEYDKQLQSIVGPNFNGLSVLYHPKESTNFGAQWSSLLIKLHYNKPIIAGSFFILMVIGCFAIIRDSTLDPILLLPYFVVLLQALAYACLLHNADRYTLALNPLLFLQLGIILGFERDEHSVDLKDFRGLLGSN